MIRPIQMIKSTQILMQLLTQSALLLTIFTRRCTKTLPTHPPLQKTVILLDGMFLLFDHFSYTFLAFYNHYFTLYFDKFDYFEFHMF